jgi:spore coat polysaccharide biosynthesis protein SpsF
MNFNKNMKDKVNVQVIIQARMGSNRLPGKILSPLAGEFSALEWIIERARCSKYAERIVVATTVNPKDEETIAVCKHRGCEYVRGSEEDVLNRFVDVLHEFPCNIVLQINADEPLFDVSEMDRLVEVLEKDGLDYVNNHPAGLPLGTGTEAFTFSAFFLMASKTNDPYDHEHVTPYFYNHTDLFKQKNLPPLEIHPFAKNVRLTLDTLEDLKFLRQLMNQMKISVPKEQPLTNDILSFLQNHPDLIEINRGIVQKTFPSKNIK